MDAEQRLRRTCKSLGQSEHCPNCGGEIKIIAAILKAPVIERILAHLGLQAREHPGLAPQRQRT